MHSQHNLQLPTVYLTSYTEISDIFSGKASDNYNEVRGRTALSKSQALRDLSMSSTKSPVAYHERMESNNAITKDVDMDEDSPGLSYKTTQEKVIQVGKAANSNYNMVNMTPQCASNAYSNMTLPQGNVLSHGNNNVINVLLSYDPNAPTDPNLWDGSLHPVFLHRSLEYLASDSKNIKNSLNFMAKYIDNKQIDLFKSNDMEDLKGIGMAIWNFMSSIYQSKWDSLNADNNGKSLRDKITAKLSPRVIPQSSRNNKPTEKLVPASIEKMLPLLPAKLKNEVN